MPLFSQTLKNVGSRQFRWMNQKTPQMYEVLEKRVQERTIERQIQGCPGFVGRKSKMLLRISWGFIIILFV